MHPDWLIERAVGERNMLETWKLSVGSRYNPEPNIPKRRWYFLAGSLCKRVFRPYRIIIFGPHSRSNRLYGEDRETWRNHVWTTSLSPPLTFPCERGSKLPPFCNLRLRVWILVRKDGTVSCSSPQIRHQDLPMFQIISAYSKISRGS